MPAPSRRRLLRAPLLAALLALPAACGGEQETEPAADPRAAAPATADTAMKVDPNSAMDTTPAGTPAPPSPATVADTL